MRHLRYTDYTDDTRILDAYIHRLRKLGYDFTTIYGVGYIYRGKQTTATEQPDAA